MGQQLVNGVFSGSIYALFAVGYTLVFGVLDILNLAHQAVFTIGAFVALELIIGWHLSLLPALLGATLFSALLGIVLDRVAFRPLRRRPDSYFSGLISSLAMATIFTSIVLQVYGPNLRRFPSGTFPDRSFQLGSLRLTLLQIAIVLTSLALTLALQLLLQRTRTGRAIRAVAESHRAARVLGIDVERIILLSFVISSALGGIAGVLYGLAFNGIDPNLGQSIELKGLSVIILGGMGSIPGAVLGGYLLGLTEVFTVASVGSPYRDAAAFIVLFLILLVRPSGLLGRKAVRAA
ncbi:MAG: branched-chain amino acid ABC transporter permease [Dehalococcoidia bacterium]